MSLLRALQARLRGLRDDDRAVAAVEFALVVPFLITLYVGSMEAAALFTVDKRINSLSATVGDLVGQWDPGDLAIPTSTLNSYMAASIGILSPYSTDGVEIVVSLVKVDETTGDTSVLWSRANDGGTVKSGSYPDLAATSEMNKISRGGCVVAAEVTYSYKPFLGVIFKTAITFKHVNYFLPRYGSSKPIEVQDTDLDDDACTA